MHTRSYVRREMITIPVNDIPHNVYDNLFKHLVIATADIRHTYETETYSGKTTKEIFTDYMLSNRYFIMVGNTTRVIINDLRKYEALLAYISGKPTASEEKSHKPTFTLWDISVATTNTKNSTNIAGAICDFLVLIPADKMLELIAAVKLVRQFKGTLSAHNGLRTSSLKIWIIICRLCGGVVIGGSDKLWEIHVQTYHFPMGGEITPTVSAVHGNVNLAEYVCNSHSPTSEIMSKAKWSTNYDGSYNKFGEPEANKVCIICGAEYEDMKNSDLECLAGCVYSRYRRRKYKSPIYNNPFRDVVISHLIDSHGDMNPEGKFAFVWQLAREAHKRVSVLTKEDSSESSSEDSSESGSESGSESSSEDSSESSSENGLDDE